jgi:hypothetical protein
MKLKKVWMLSVFVFLFHMKNSMINIFSFFWIILYSILVERTR